MDPTQRIKDAIREACLSEFQQLRSIILTGSMARQESFFSNRNDSWICEGDAECLLAFDRLGKDLRDSKVANITKQINDRLRSEGIRCPVTLSAVTIQYFREMQPHIFGYELRECGDVIAGDPTVLELIPKFESHDIPKEDGWRMLSNRSIELLECAASDLGLDEPLSPALRYKTAKLCLDMGSSYLLFQNAFETGYARRAKILERLASAHLQHPFQSLPAFVARVCQATRYKLQGEGGFGERTSCVFDAVIDAKALWFWELNQLSNSPNRMPRESMYQRLRGWAFVARQSGWQVSLRHWPRWLSAGLRSSPRYSIYCAATGMIFGLEEPFAELNTGLALDEMMQLLPVVRHKQRANWRELAVEIGWNYHQFLEATRA